MPRLLRTVARTAVVAGTATAVSNRVSRRQAGRWADQGAQQAPPVEPEPVAAAAPAPVAAAPATDMDSRIEQLKQLGGLRDQGVLSDEEFAAQKAKVLGL
ncbi:SHOCT domain-containing protein [Streptomyces sp. RKAG337]|uniref:SHOCT domain-containing protein n=1 Tax=Streptomyces sp. RKAG337 TaxID=2893404 RepID=UPI0020343BA2|nr:SHOCT domain-containing protein [Streptomyces sp. RKAG337]MCM2427693.1 SHOCT domain-containing protein [Streptomyces sp. RKAG337]